MTDITDCFALDSIDHHELLILLGCRYASCWRVSDHNIAFPATENHELQLDIRHGVIHRISRGPGMTEEILTDLLAEIDGNLRDDRIIAYGRNILFASLPVKGAFRLKSQPLQILPPPDNAPKAPYQHIEHAFVLEYPLRAYKSQQFGMGRRFKNAMEWTWILNVFVHGSIRTLGSRARHMWASRLTVVDEPPFWATENYFISGFQGLTPELSIAAAPPVPLIPASSYYGNARQRLDAGAPIDALSLPDNLDDLVWAMTRLSGDERRRFLRSALSIYIARETWDSSLSSYFLACVQALETLVDQPRATACQACGKSTSPGPTKLFRELIERYRGDSQIDERVLSEMYRVRSAMAHGRYLFQMDEAPWSFATAGALASWGEREMVDAAVGLAKTVLRNWLLKTAAST